MVGATERPVVSVVLGTYNRRHFLEQAILSVRQNGAATPYEIIVVDGGSTDGTIAWLVEQEDILTIVQQDRRSRGYFMNLGSKAAQGKYVLLIGDDCLLVPGAIDVGVDRFQALARAGRHVAGVAFYCRDWPTEAEYYVRQTFGGKVMVDHGMYRREAMEAVGWADEDRYISSMARDDLSLKLWEVGLEIVDGPGAFVEHYRAVEVELGREDLDGMTRDREAYRARWSGIFRAPEGMEPPERVPLAYDDPHRTVRRFPLGVGSVEAAETPIAVAPVPEKLLAGGVGALPRPLRMWDRRSDRIRALETRLALVETGRDLRAADRDKHLAQIQKLTARVSEIAADSEKRLALIRSLAARAERLSAELDDLRAEHEALLLHPVVRLFRSKPRRGA